MCMLADVQHWCLPLARCRRGHAGTASPCHGDTSWASGEFLALSFSLCAHLLVMAVLFPLTKELYYPTDLGFVLAHYLTDEPMVMI
jgi:hypothetical protein